MTITRSKPGWWSKIGRWVLLALLLALLAGAGYLLFSIFVFGWPMESGFGDYNSPPTAAEKKFERAKTLWDWMQLLVIPFVLAIAAYFLNRTERVNAEKAAEQRAATERRIADQRAEQERQIADERAKQERQIADERAKQERQIADQRALDAVLETYLDRMEKLLLDKNLLKSQPDDEVRDIARIRTLTALRRLDTVHNQILLTFIEDAGLFRGRFTPPFTPDVSIINLSEAYLAGVDLREAFLLGANLNGANLEKANLNGANLNGANLNGANLNGADLNGADLNGANLNGAFLIGTNLREADLKEANLQGAELGLANLEGANLQGATMPDGSKHE